MAYVLGQYNKLLGQDDNIFMRAIPNGWCDRKEASSGIFDETNPFENECCGLGTFAERQSFELGKNYYFHGKIRRTFDGNPQEFNIKLVNYQPPEGEEGQEQYIKTITIPAFSRSSNSDDWTKDWVDIEFVFTPVATFDTLLFELVRTIGDYRDSTRYPNIAYEEISYVDNIIPTKIPRANELIKIGVQSHPGLLMCINGEEIHNSRSGIYEIKNGVITVSFFSVLFPCDETTSSMDDWLEEVYDKINRDFRPWRYENTLYYTAWTQQRPYPDAGDPVYTDYYGQNDSGYVVSSYDSGTGKLTIINSDPEPSTIVCNRVEFNETEAERLRAEKAKEAGSRCFFNTDKTRVIDNFSLDYMYREETEGDGT